MRALGSGELRLVAALLKLGALGRVRELVLQLAALRLVHAGLQVDSEALQRHQLLGIAIW